MAARRHEISLRVFFQHEKRNFVSPRGHVISSIYYINTSEIPNHFTLIVFGVKGAIYYLVFARKLTWYFIGVYIIKVYFYPLKIFHLFGFPS